MEIAVIPPDDSGTVLLPKIDLPLTDHLDAPPAKIAGDRGQLRGFLIYHTSITT
jgi:hypothetical protein